MPVVWIPALLRDMTGGEAAVTVPGETVGQVIEQLDERYPGIKGRLCRGGRLRPNIAVAVDGEVRGSGLQHRLTEMSEVCFLPALSGGSEGSPQWQPSAVFWRRDDGGNVDLMHLAPEPDRRAFRTLGCDHAAVPRTDVIQRYGLIVVVLRLGQI